MKRRVVSVFLVIFAIWPLCHFGLVKLYDIDPWKLVGFAMYSVPGIPKLVRVVGMDELGKQDILKVEDYEPEEAQLITAFKWRRTTLGRLASDNGLAERLLEIHPKWAGLAILVASPELDRETAHVKIQFEHNTHWREGRERAPFYLPRWHLLALFKRSR